MELSLWANHPKAQPSLQVEGRRTPSVTIKTKMASDYSRRHPMTYIRCQSHVILGLVFAYQFRRRFGLRPPCHTPQPEL